MLLPALHRAKKSCAKSFDYMNLYIAYVEDRKRMRNIGQLASFQNKKVHAS